MSKDIQRVSYEKFAFVETIKVCMKNFILTLGLLIFSVGTAHADVLCVKNSQAVSKNRIALSSAIKVSGTCPSGFIAIVDTTSFKGAKGDPGVPGATGVQGASGPTGPAGANGSQGASGPTGPAGANGSQGASGPTGPAGANGSQGASGPTGPAGANGSQGASGPTGAAGANGVQGVQGPPGQAIWGEVTDTQVEAVAGHGYIANNPNIEVMVVLPASPTIGDVFRVAGIGNAGWRVALASGQSITSPDQQNWASIALSSDGTRFSGAVSNGYIYTSSSAGMAGTLRSAAGNRRWASISSSADGTKLVADFLMISSNYLMVSIDGGITWAPKPINVRGSCPSSSSVSISSDGSTIAAGCPGRYVSTDLGTTWTGWEGDTGGGRGVALSANGSVIYQISSGITRSTNFGVSYEGISGGPASGPKDWRAIATSSDGTKLVAAAGVASGGSIFTSTDTGINYTERTSAGSRSWSALAMSSNGAKIVAAVSGGYIYTSDDSGASWNERTGAGSLTWRSLAMSSNGGKIIATAGSGIYQSTDFGVSWTLQQTPGEYIIGGAGATVELLYAGQNKYSVLSGVSYRVE